MTDRLDTSSIEYYLHPDNIKETVEFFEKHTQFWKKSQFLAITQEVERLRSYMNKPHRVANFYKDQIESLTKERNLLKGVLVSTDEDSDLSDSLLEKVKELEAENATLTRENAELEKNFKTLEKNFDDVWKRQQALKKENAELKKKLEWLPNKDQVIKELEAENAGLKAKVEELELYKLGKEGQSDAPF